MSSTQSKPAGQHADARSSELPPADPTRPSDKGGAPAYVGPSQPKLVVVGERFEREDEPFGGFAGLFFKEVLLEAGIKPDKSGFCYGGGELLELLVLRPVWVVLSGDVALQGIRPDLQTRGMHGRPVSLLPMSERGPRDARLGGSVGFSVVHHVALRRKPKEWHDLVLQELLAFRRMATDPEGWLKYTPDTCVKCRGEFFRIDDQGIVYCEEHWELRGADGLAQLVHAFNLDSGEHIPAELDE